MFEKTVMVSLDPQDICVLDSTLVKTASESIFPPDFTPEADELYILVRGVSAGEYWGENVNLDYFEEAELKESHITFKNGKVFIEHANKNPLKNNGRVVYSKWEDDMKAVIILLAFRKSSDPAMAKAILNREITDVSMGCRVKYVMCSYCGKKAKTREEYCSHLINQRGKTMENGVKVYEINRGCNFHDISIVKRGADRTAKHQVIMDGAEMTKELEKAASEHQTDTMDTLLQKFIAPKPSEDLWKVASAMRIKPRPEPFNKKAFVEKLAELEKVVTGNIIGVETAALGRHMDGVDIDEVADTIRLFYTKYWDDEKIDEVVEKIKSIARKRDMSEDDAFNAFIQASELCGIELSPLEFDKIAERLTGVPSGLPDAVKDIAEKSTPNVIKISIKASRPSEAPLKGNIPLSLRAHTNLVDNFEGGARGSVFSDNSDAFALHDIFNSILRDEAPHRSFKEPYMSHRIIKIINDDAPENAFEHFAPIAISKMAPKPGISGAIASILNYLTYQAGRPDFISRPSTPGLMAIMIEGPKAITKEAAFKYTTGKALTFGLPMTFGYSALQRARINNGEDVSGFNRYVAENPANAFVIQAIAGPRAWNLASKGVGNVATAKNNLATEFHQQRAAAKASRLAKQQMDGVAEQPTQQLFKTKPTHQPQPAQPSNALDFAAADPLGGGSNKNPRSILRGFDPSDMDDMEYGDMINFINKKASVDGSEAIFKIASIMDRQSKGDYYFALSENMIGDGFAKLASEGYNVYKDEDVDLALRDMNYSDQQIHILKRASLVFTSGDEVTSDQFLEMGGLGREDVQNFLKTASDAVRSYIEKTAEAEMSDLEGTMRNTAAGMLFFPKKNVSPLSLMPGTLLDGYLFHKLTKRLNANGSQDQKPLTTEGGIGNEFNKQNH